MQLLRQKPFLFTQNIEKQKLFLPRKPKGLLGSFGKKGAII
jgi:hypothetical protein